MDIVERLDGLVNAYPLDIFPEPTTEERVRVEEERPGLQSQVVASWARRLGPTLAEARDEITALRARVAGLEQALEPFALDDEAWTGPDCLEIQMCAVDDQPQPCVSLGDVRRARAALSRADGRHDR